MSKNVQFDVPLKSKLHIPIGRGSTRATVIDFVVEGALTPVMVKIGQRNKFCS
jgi:hypothetical protein